MGKIEDRLQVHVESLIDRYPSLSVCKQDIIDSYILLEDAYKNGNKLLIAGNGGSAADAEHIAGELMKRSGRKARGN